MLIAQITDCHIAAPGLKIFEEVDTAARLSATVAFLNALSPRPDLVVATGDLVDQGLTGEYEHLCRLLAPLAMPVYLLPGNHDNRDAMRAVFHDHGYMSQHGDLDWVIDYPGLSLIGVDTTVPGAPSGNLSPERIARLDRVLNDRPRAASLIFMHHPPFLTGQESLDNFMCFGGDRLAALAGRHKHIEAVLCGHHHQALVARWAGVTVAVAPATAYQIAVDRDDREPGRWTLEPAGCMLHRWSRDRGLMSRIVQTEPAAEMVYGGPSAGFALAAE